MATTGFLGDVSPYKYVRIQWVGCKIFVKNTLDGK